MSQKTSIYSLEYLEVGSNYSASIDYRRFVTLDYNLESYVGVVGVGIISGWTIESVSGLEIRILPGKGIIDGFFAESPYTIKQRSDMVAGDREIEVRNENDITESNLADTDSVVTPSFEYTHYHFIDSMDDSGNGFTGNSIGDGTSHFHQILLGIVQTSESHIHALYSQRWDYVNIIKLYDSTYSPTDDIENSYVKVVVPYSITLGNNNDNYIYANLPSIEPSGSGYRPKLSAAENYPEPAGRRPRESDYASYADYQTAIAVYNAKLQTIHDYEWYLYDGNRFTEVAFTFSGALNITSKKILLGRVVTRSGEVTNIDVSKVDSVANMQSAIKKVAAEYIYTHQHGGNKPFDPPRIRLETDTRSAVLSFYKSDSSAIFTVTERKETTSQQGHKHSYKIDANGNGQTIGQTGSTYQHFHKIEAFVVGFPELTAINVVSHTHEIPTITDTADTWTSDSQYIVYVNDVPFADETTSYVHADVSKKQITFDKGISVLNNKYSTSFSITFEDPSPNSTSSTKTILYQYSGREVSVYNFMLRMINDFNQTFQYYYTTEITGEANASQLSKLDLNITSSEQLAAAMQITNAATIARNIANNPFNFMTTDADGNVLSIAGRQDLQTQSTAAQTLLREVGDTFIFTPNAANDIKIVLEEKGHIDTVQIEILGNTEVTGELLPENILFINANKILLGELSVERIPFIGHMGRMNESFYPLQYGMFSNDGIRYYIVPAITSTTLSHNHKLLVDTNVTGVTTSVMVGNNTVYYETDSNQNVYFISHAHGVNGVSVLNSSSDGLLQWINNVSSSNTSSNVVSSITSSDHTHEIIYPVDGNNKTIYAIKEDISGNIYLGTSDGFLMVPSDSTYSFVINSNLFYSHNSNFWIAFQIAVAQYEKQTKNSILLTSDVKAAIESLATSSLVNENDSFFIEVSNYPNRPKDSIVVTKISSFQMPNFESIQIKKAYEVLSDEVIIDTVVNTSSTTTGDTDAEVIVSKDFNDIPIWSIELHNITTSPQDYVSPNIEVDVFVLGSSLAAKSANLNSSPYQTWQSVGLPMSVGVARKVIKDYNDNYWVCTNNGILVSRNFTSGNNFSYTSLPAGQPDIMDIVEGEKGSIYCVSVSGVFKTINGGKTWTKLHDVINGFKQIVRDVTTDRTDSLLGHYHIVEVDIEGNGFLSESQGSGVVHIHSVNSWTIESTLGHTHSLKVTLYTLDNNNVIWKSRNNGKTWKEYGTLPDGECGEIFASFGYLFVNQEDGLYRSSNGAQWDNVFKNKVYSFALVYDRNGFYVGCDNLLYNTFDGINFELVYQFSGNPASVLMQKGVKKNFGYAYSNINKSFHFKNLVVDASELTALVDFEKWYAKNGSWDTTDLYDIYINNKRILSTKSNQDDRETTGFNFNVNPSEALLDFGATTTLIVNAKIYDAFLVVEYAADFNAGDSIVITYSDQSYHAIVSSVSGNNLNLVQRLGVSIDMPANINRLAYLNGSSSVSANIYNTLLSNIGKNNHDELENNLSLYSDYRPYKFNSNYLSNLLQLTQATRYVYPDINSKFINDKFYDFRYSWSPSDPLYPSIYDYIDVSTSDVYNQKFYDSNTTINRAKSINKILVGYGSFSGYIFAATDIGIFWSKLESNYEANWFYVDAVPFAAYDLIIFGTTVLIAATNNGTYKTIDMKTWELQSNPAISYSSYCLGLRWTNQGAVIVPSHTVDFTFDATDANNVSGVITALVGTPYLAFTANQGIQIDNAGDKSGNYVIKSVSDGGAGFGSQLIVNPAFEGDHEIISGVVITMGAWWGQWNGDINTSNANLTNTLLIGGLDHLSYSDGGSNWFWQESNFDISNFAVKNFLPLTTGRMLASATGNSPVSQENHLLKSDDIGQNWKTLMTFSEITGIITNTYLSDFNNTVLEVSYTLPSTDAAFSDGIMDQLNIAIYTADVDTAVFRGKIIGNQQIDSTQKIVIFGNELNGLIHPPTIYRFVVSPSSINTMVETFDQTLLYGTDRGIYNDVNSVVSNNYPQGTILGAGIKGVVNKIDVSGQILNISINSNNQSVLSIYADTPIRGVDMAGKTLYITDTSPVESYTIVNSGSVAPGDEATITLDTNIILPNSYVGKKFRIIGGSSRVYVDWEMPVLINQFVNGKIYVVSDDNDNIGASYSINHNGIDYIDIGEIIVPASTLVEAKKVSSTTTTTTTSIVKYPPLQIGQTIMPFAEDNRLTLWVSMDAPIKENELAALSMSIIGNVSGGITTFSIHSNENNSITLDSFTNMDDLSLFIIDRSAINKAFITPDPLFKQLGGFSHLSTSVDSGHYHEVETINAMVSGTIDSFDYVDTSYVDINVIDTINFDSPMAQFRSDLFHDAKIVFTNNESMNLRYTSEVVSHSLTTIRVKIKYSSYWNFDAYDVAKISNGWKWEIDATNYGYTSSIDTPITLYSDFNIINMGVTETAVKTSNLISVNSSEGVAIGDKIRIQDDTLSYEYNSVEAIINDVTIQVATLPTRTYFKEKNPQIKVLRDSFTNTHLHQIRNNEVEILTISDYLEKGYPAQHAHRVLPLIADVSVLLNQGNRIIAMGSASKLYNSYDNGATWELITDLNKFLEGSNEIDGISTCALNNNIMLVGATNGNIFVEVANDGQIIELSKPI